MTTLTLSQLVENVTIRWNRDALRFCASHGAKGGTFVTELWANGCTMVSVPGSLPNQAITVGQLAELANNGWKIYV